jgi:hypothetical protein
MKWLTSPGCKYRTKDRISWLRYSMGFLSAPTDKCRKSNSHYTTTASFYSSLIVLIFYVTRVSRAIKQYKSVLWVFGREPSMVRRSANWHALTWTDNTIKLLEGYSNVRNRRSSVPAYRVFRFYYWASKEAKGDTWGWEYFGTTHTCVAACLSNSLSQQINALPNKLLQKLLPGGSAVHTLLECPP